MYNSNVLGGFMKRFIEAHEKYYDQAYKEIKKGYKKTHWMWFIFPQIIGLGKSYTAIYYSINDMNEINEYINNEYLMNNYLELCNVLLELKTNNPIEVFGSPDYMKLQSSLTLFYFVSKNEIIKKVLDKYYDGRYDDNTLKILNSF